MPTMLRLLVIILSIGVSVSTAWAQIRFEVVATGFTTPVAFVQDPVQPNVQFVVEQGGRIRVVRDGAVLPQDFLNLTGQITSGGERGLLGLAFAPDYAVSRRFFVNFTNLAGHTVIARFLRSTTDPVVADPTSRFDLLWPDGNRFITQPFANHNGGDLHFGSDGFLYIGMGDGGSANDPFHNAQDPESLLGKMLRIDVAVADTDLEGYDAPADNPFLGPVGSLIWAFGLRNPFRFTVDEIANGGTGALVIGDVGQNAWEEVDYGPFGRGGRNYGWRNREGAHDNVLTEGPAFTPLIDPIIEYSHAIGNVITGGVVYRGTLLGSQFVGRYFYADFGSGRIWSAFLNVDSVTGEATAQNIVEHTTELGGPSAVGNISAFGLDANREMYIVSYSGGLIARVLSTGGTLPDGGSGGTCTIPDPFVAIGGGVCVGGGWLPAGHPLAGGTPTPPPPPGPTPPSTGCASPQPASDWVCVNGGWLPPNHPLAAGGGSTPPPTPPPTPPSGPSTCTTPDPFAAIGGGVCVNGGWLPANHPLAGGAGSGSGTGTPACTTPMPASDWVCVNGGWRPPGNP
jgi:glucose/arabinose dehydrogenase